MTGAKRYEFRKAIFRKKDVERVYMYSTRPVGKIVGTFRVAMVVEDRPENLWEMLGEFSGLDEDDFFAYFRGKDKGFAIQIHAVEQFNPPLDPKVLIPRFVPPQSFRYFDSGVLDSALNAR